MKTTLKTAIAWVALWLFDRFDGLSLLVKKSLMFVFSRTASAELTQMFFVREYMKLGKGLAEIGLVGPIVTPEPPTPIGYLTPPKSNDGLVN